MINSWHLLWIIPLSAFFGMMVISMCMVSKEQDEYIIDNSDDHILCRYSGEPCSKELLNVYEDNCRDCVNKPFDGKFPDWCEEERRKA